MRTAMRSGGVGAVVLAIVLGFFLAGVRCGQSVAARDLAEAARVGRPWRVRGEDYVPVRFVDHQAITDALYRELGRVQVQPARSHPDHPTEEKP